MRDFSSIVVALLIAVVVAMPAFSADYTIDPDRSELVVRLFKGGMASGLAHDHAIRAATFDGRLAWDPGLPTAASVEIRVDARSLVVDEPATRARHGLDGELPAKDRQKVQETMESAKQLDVETHPDMAFRSTAVRDLGDGSVEVTGDLTLHGATRSVRFLTSPMLEEGSLTASAEIDFLQSDFGIKPYSAVLGAVKVQDRAQLVVHFVSAPAAAEKDSSGETTREGQ